VRLFQCFLAVGAIVLLVGCGEGGSAETGDGRPTPPEKLRTLYLTLDGTPGPEAAGVLVASKQGYFAEVGLDVVITPPSDPVGPLNYVPSGEVDVGISHQPQVVLSREKGAKVVAFGSLVPEPTMAMIWLEGSGIDDVSDLKGKTIGYPGVPFQIDFLATVLERAGLTLDDVRLLRAEYKLVPALARERVDAIFGGSWNVEGAELEAQGLQPVVTRAQDLGIPSYDELVLMARRDRVAKDPELFRRLMAAVDRGTAAAIEDPEAAAEAILELRRAEFLPTDRKATEAGLEETLPLLSESGQIDPEQARRLEGWMREQGLIRN
jgi:putative hydroxymethylpyrimidine transport system substrate-binding protein